MNEFDNYNGFLVEKGEKLFNTGNRSFKFGDGIFETMRVENGKVVYWEDHYKRLKLGLTTLQLDDKKFPVSKWEEEIEKVVYKNKYQYAKLRLTVYRESPGLYTPMTNKLGFVIEGVRYDRSDFSPIKKGVRLGLYEGMDKGVNVSSNCKTTSALVYVMAAMEKKKLGLDDALVLNSKGNVCESSNSNVFIVKDKDVYTPALTEGCIQGVMRSNVIEQCLSKGIVVHEVALSKEEVLGADEVFLTNVISGVRPVKEYLGQQKEIEVSLQVQSYFS